MRAFVGRYNKDRKLPEVACRTHVCPEHIVLSSAAVKGGCTLPQVSPCSMGPVMTWQVFIQNIHNMQDKAMSMHGKDQYISCWTPIAQTFSNRTHAVICTVSPQTSAFFVAPVMV